MLRILPDKEWIPKINICAMTMANKMFSERFLIGIMPHSYKFQQWCVNVASQVLLSLQIKV